MIRFSKNYSKLRNKTFTTIRKNTKYYQENKIYLIRTPNGQFKAKIVNIYPIKKENITDSLASFDADCSKSELIEMLEKWYGKDFNDFILLTLGKEKEKGNVLL